MELETVNKLYLELSQVATAKTKKESELEVRVRKLTEAIENHKRLISGDGLRRIWEADTWLWRTIEKPYDME